MPDIFLSYNREDQQRARLFAEALQSAGYDVWWDVDLKTGEDYDQVTETALKQARAVVVLWSIRSVDSRWVRAEATVAQRNRSFVPVMIEDCIRPVMFELTQTSNLIGWDGDPGDPAWRGFLADLKAHLAQRGAAEGPRGARASERRQVAVVSCVLDSADGDLNGDGEADPEEWHEIVQTFQRAATAALADFDCVINPGAGGAVTALFGVERSREDDALRAVRAALAAVAAVEDLPGRPQARVGVDCGPAIVIAGEGRPPTGPVLDNATRLQMQAQAGAVLVSPAIARLAGGFLKLESRGPRAFQVFGESAVHTRFELSRARGLTRFVGRNDVFDLLNDALERSAHGSGQVVGVMAEAGAGKSRLCFEFTEQCRARGLEVFSASATQQQQNTPLFAVLAMLRSFFGVEDLDDDATARGKIEARALHLDARLATSLPVIFELLSVADPDRPSSPIDPDGRRRQLVSLARHVIGLASASHPTVTLIEDLHWLDDASAAFLEQLANARDGLNNLLIVNYRPEFRASWLQNSHCRQISLAPLGDDAVGSLLDDLLGGDPSVAALAAPIAAQTKGNPYFVEEVVQTLVETGKIEGHRGAYRLVSALEKLEVPATVKAVVSARIDRLPNRERNLLQVAAVIGDSFSETLLAAASGFAMADLEAAVSALRRTEFIVERAVFPVVEHAFKHPLTLEMALASLVKARRRELHADVARAIEAEAGDESASQAAMLAYHWDEAGERLVAAQWHLTAGHRTSRTDFFAAARHWRRVLDLCEGLDDPMATLMFVDAASQLLTAGYRLGMDLDEAKALLARGEAVIGPDGSPLFGLILSVCYSRALCVDGDVGAYRALSRENHVAAMASGDLRLQVIAKFRLCDSLTHSGSHLECLAEAEAGMAFCPLDQPRPDWLPDYHPHLFFGFMRGVALTWLGRLADAERQLLDVIELAKTDGSIEVVAWCSLQLSIAYSLMGDCGRSLEAAQTVATISERLGSPLLIAYRHVAFIRAYSCAGSFEKALPEVTAAIELFGYIEQHWAAMGKMHLAHCLLELGRKTEALETAELAVEGFRTCNITHNEVEALGLLARARLRVEGAAASVAVERLLRKAEEIIDAERMETLRPFLHEWRAELARTRGDEAASARLLERAAEGHAANGAERQAARLRNQVLKVLS